jgi:hypothetical protein
MAEPAGISADDIPWTSTPLPDWPDADSYRALALAAIEQLHVASAKIARQRGALQRAADERARLRAFLMPDALDGDEELVVLRGGLRVPLVALKLAWQLEDAGVTLYIQGDDLFARPAARVPAALVPRLRQHRDALKAIARYCEAPPPP